MLNLFKNYRTVQSRLKTGNKVFVFFIFFVYAGTVSTVSSQINLVPNPGFETLTSCPDNNGQIWKAYPWFSPSTCPFSNNINTCSSSDVCSTCAINNPPNDFMGVPASWLGYQYPRTGNNYAGISFWLNNGVREYIEVELLQELIAGKSYCVSFYVANTLIDPVFTSTSNLQLAFSTDTLMSSNYAVISVNPAMKNADSAIVTDTVNWVVLCGSYTAVGGEKFLTIGNFYFNSASNVVNPNAQAAYYFIDDVSVIESETCCGNTLSNAEIIIPNVFTPNNDDFNDLFRVENAPEDLELIIINRWGEIIFKSFGANVFWDGYTKAGMQCPEGVYYYLIETKTKKHKGLVHLLR